MVYPKRYSEEKRRRRQPSAAATQRAGYGGVTALRCSSLAYRKGYATLLAPCAVCPGTQRGHARSRPRPFACCLR